MIYLAGSRHIDARHTSESLHTCSDCSQAENRTAKETVASMPFDGAWVKSTEYEGECFEIQYTAKEAGDFELHVWCDPDGSGTRQWLTGSPFSVRVSGVRPSTTGSFVGPVDAVSEPMAAGGSMVLRPQLRDQFGNASSAAQGEFEVFIETPGDGVHPLELKTLKGLGAYEVSRSCRPARLGSFQVVSALHALYLSSCIVVWPQVTCDVQLKGRHLVQFLLHKEHISGSPVEFDVLPDKALAAKSRCYPPSEPPLINQPCEILVEAVDKFGNRLEVGGSRVDARASGPGVSACTTEDQQDGTYIVSFTAAVVGETRVIVRLDNNEMAPLKLVFVAPGEGGSVEAGRKGKKASNAGDSLAPAAAPASAPAGE